MSHPESIKPPVNEAARIVNSHFLQTPYEGKDWESVRKDLIDELTEAIATQINEGLEQKMYELSRMKAVDAIDEIARVGNRKYNREAQRKHRESLQDKERA